MKSAFEQIRVLLELKEKGSISEEEFKQMLAILENESAKDSPETQRENVKKESNPVEDYQESVQKMEQVLEMLIHNGRLDEARQRYDKFPFKSSIKTSLVQELQREKEDINITKGESKVEKTTKEQKDEGVENEVDSKKKTKPAVEEDIQTDWVEFNSSNTIPFYKKLTIKQWILIVLGLFILSFISKRPNFIWDKDSDSVYNWRDICPNKAGSVKCFGCPDKDNDGTTDNLDLDISDKDHDHIPDINDLCPNTWGPIENEGCPTSRQIPKRSKTKEDILKGAINTKNYENLKYIFGLKFIRLVNNHYEISNQDFKGFKKINDPLKINVLNKEFGLNITVGSKEKEEPVNDNIGKNSRIAFPSSKVNEAKLALNDLKFVKSLSTKEITILKNKIQDICNDYFNGLISGKYEDDVLIIRELKEIQSEQLQFELKTKFSQEKKGSINYPESKIKESKLIWENITYGKNDEKYRQRYKNIVKEYFDGVVNGTYFEDKKISYEFKRNLKFIDNF